MTLDPRESPSAAPWVPPPTNPWFPTAAVSGLLPPLGLLLIRDGRDRRSFALTLFAAFGVGMLLLWALYALLGTSSEVQTYAGLTYRVSLENAFGFIVRVVRFIIWLSSALFGVVYTHDETVRAFPHLGEPLFFPNALDLPPKWPRIG